MKTINSLLLLLLSLACSAQQGRVYCRIDQDASEVSWSVVNLTTGETLASGANQNNAQMVWAEFEMPPGTYQISVNDSGGNGWPRGMFMLTLCGLPQFLTLGQFTSQVQATQIYTLEVCPPCACDGPDCPGDINQDGVVGVSDVITMISFFGTTCP